MKEFVPLPYNLLEAACIPWLIVVHNLTLASVISSPFLTLILVFPSYKTFEITLDLPGESTVLPYLKILNLIPLIKSFLLPKDSDVDILVGPLFCLSH